jgi:hypothetical protein
VATRGAMPRLLADVFRSGFRPRHPVSGLRASNFRTSEAARQLGAPLAPR